MKRLIYILQLSVMLVLCSCISEFNANLPTSDTDLLVVEGDIIGNTTQTIYLRKTYPMSDTVTYTHLRFQDLQANVSLVGSDGTNIKAINSGNRNGSYLLEIGDLDENTEYSLIIEYDGETYQTTPSKPLITPEIDSITFRQPEKYGDVTFYVSTHSDDENASYYLWNYEEDWEIFALYYTNYFVNEQSEFYTQEPAPYYYCWCNNRINPILIESTDSQSKNAIVNKTLYTVPSEKRFQSLYSVKVKQRALSGAAYEYYRSKQTSNQDMGGLFTPQPTEPNGNVICTTNSGKKALGFIEVLKNISEMRIYVGSSAITRKNSMVCELIPHGTVLSMMSEALIETYWGAAVMLSIRPVVIGGDMTEGSDPESWAAVGCTDCRSAGGSKTRPDFWPDNGHY
ncbi:MAG: DUF4249 domain-containing protein [Dysgonamonadaceae bacterium]|nr:DUF4249 domain-containing protein [Dysgonamonadaceae bacterium]